MLFPRRWIQFSVSVEEPEASFTLCCDVDDTQAFERTQLSQFRAHAGKTPFTCSSLYHKKRSVEFTSERMDGEGLMGLNNVHLERKINGAAARQEDSASNAADGQKQKYIFQLFNNNTLKEVCLALWKNLNRQASQNSEHRNPQHRRTHKHAHTFFQAVMPGGQCVKGCAGHWWQGNHGLELIGSHPPLKAHSWVQFRKQRGNMREKRAREDKQR